MEQTLMTTLIDGGVNGALVIGLIWFAKQFREQGKEAQTAFKEALEQACTTFAQETLKCHEERAKLNDTLLKYLKAKP